MKGMEKLGMILFGKIKRNKTSSNIAFPAYFEGIRLKFRNIFVSSGEILYLYRMKKADKKYKISPFIPKIGYVLKEQWKLVRTKGSRIRKKRSGLDMEVREETRVRDLVDNSAFLKVYENSDFLDAYIGLTLTGQRTLNWILKNIEYEKYGMYIHNAILARETGLNESQVSKGMREIAQEDWIAKSEIPKFYFINIDRVFKGDREKVYKEYKATVLR